MVWFACSSKRPKHIFRIGTRANFNVMTPLSNMAFLTCVSDTCRCRMLWLVAWESFWGRGGKLDTERFPVPGGCPRCIWGWYLYVFIQRRYLCQFNPLTTGPRSGVRRLSIDNKLFTMYAQESNKIILSRELGLLSKTKKLISTCNRPPSGVCKKKAVCS